MDLQTAYSKIDEHFSKYISTNNEAEKSKMLKIICDVINTKYKYNEAILNGDLDYLPVLTATNSAIKSFNPNLEGQSFHKYLFVSINNAVRKDIGISKIKEQTNLNYTDIKLLKKIKKLLPMYQDNRQKVADALNISLKQVETLLYSQVFSLNKKMDGEDSNSESGDFIMSANFSAADKAESEEELNLVLDKLDSVWKNIKPVHQSVVSDWLTAKTLSACENSTKLEFMNQKNTAMSFLSEFQFINPIIVKKFFEEKDYLLPLTFDNIGQLHGITKSAVCKKISIFTEELRKQI